MSKAEERVIDQALSLPAEERISLVEKLLSSLNLPTQADIDRVWSEEAERRVGEIESGSVELIPGQEVFEKVRKKYGR